MEQKLISEKKEACSNDSLSRAQCSVFPYIVETLIASWQARTQTLIEQVQYNL